MAELVASLVGLVGAGTKVAMVLSHVASEIGSAGKEPQIMAREIRSFCTIIRLLSQTMDSVHSEMTWNNYTDCLGTISDMMVVSQDMFTEILNLISSIQKSSLGGSGLPNNSKFNLASRIRWIMNKPKFIFLRSALEAYKSNLSLLLGSIQLSQSLALASSSSGSSGDIIQQAGTNRASLALSIDLQDIANDYRASIQEMEAARLEAENEASYEPPPWDSQPDEMGVDDATTTNAQQDPELREMIATAEEEVRSLRPSSSVYSDSTASIYSSLSRHSTRMSVIVDDLATNEVVNHYRRNERMNAYMWSEAFASRDDIFRNTLRSVREAQTWGSTQPPTHWDEPPPRPQTLDDAEKEFRDLLTKYKNVKRLYFDGKQQIEALETKLSVAQTPSSTDNATRDEAVQSSAQTPSSTDNATTG